MIGHDAGRKIGPSSLFSSSPIWSRTHERREHRQFLDSCVPSMGRANRRVPFSPGRPDDAHAAEHHPRSVSANSVPVNYGRKHLNVDRGALTSHCRGGLRVRHAFHVTRPGPLAEAATGEEIQASLRARRRSRFYLAPLVVLCHAPLCTARTTGSGGHLPMKTFHAHRNSSSPLS